jgi:multidrug efflux pump subunit AcrB
MATLFFRLPRLTLLAIFLTLAAGLAALGVMGRQEDPSLTERFGVVVASFPGADAERMEALIVEPIEAALMELVELDEVDSTIRSNIALIGVDVREDLSPAMVEQAWTKVRDQVSAVEASLPDGVLPLRVERQYMGAATLVVSLSWPEDSEAGLGVLSRLAEDLADRIRSVPGTDETDIFGAPEEEVRVTLDPKPRRRWGSRRLTSPGCSRDRIPRRRQAVWREALDVNVDVAGAFETLDRVRDVPVAQGDQGFLRLSDIASVERTLRTPNASESYFNGRRTILVAGYLEPELAGGRLGCARTGGCGGVRRSQSRRRGRDPDGPVRICGGPAVRAGAQSGLFGADRVRRVVLHDGLAQRLHRRVRPAAHRAAGDGADQFLRRALAPDVGDGAGRRAGVVDR